MPRTMAVIGAGAVGLAIAYALQRRFPNDTTIVLERESKVGTGTSSRNSEVRHTPIHYPAGSLKERLCADGGKLLDDFCREQNIPYERTGKFVVATDKHEEGLLEHVLHTAKRTGTNVSLLSGREVREGSRDIRPEPLIHCTRAVYLPDTAVFDTHAFTAALQHAFSESGGTVAFGLPVTAIDVVRGKYSIDGERFDIIVNAAGLHAVDVASAAGISTYEGSVRYVKGSYWNIPQQAVHALVYPVPTEHSLGIHYTRSVIGDARLGPSAEILDQQPSSFPADVYGVRDDANERKRFLAAGQRYFPHLTANDLSPGTSGIRTQQALPKAKRDFIISEETTKGFPGFVNLIGIESPGLTAALAIGEYVAHVLQKR